MSVRNLLKGPVIIADYGGMDLVASVDEIGVIIPVTMSFPELFDHPLCSLILASAPCTAVHARPVVGWILLEGTMLPADYRGLGPVALVNEFGVIEPLAMGFPESLKNIVDGQPSFQTRADT